MLDNVRIASPCRASWESMEGTEQMRFCPECSKHVYNISAMTRRDAERLLSTSDKLCARFYRRADGTILTEDCPMGLRNRAAKVRRRVSLAISGWMGVATAFAQTPAVQDRLVTVEQSVRTISGVVRDPTAAPVPNASLILTDKKTGGHVETRSNQRGEYRFAGVAPGVYALRVESAGFAVAMIDAIEIDQVATVKLDPKLELGVLVGEVVMVSKRSFFRRILHI